MSGFQPAVRAVVAAAMDQAKRNPNSADLAAQAGKALHAHDQFAAAVVCYQRAHALDPKRPDYLYYWGAALSSDGKYEAAIGPLRRAAALDPARTAARLKLADAFFAAGQSDEARREYREVLERDANNPAAHYGVGRTLPGAEAIAEFARALELFPRYGAAQFALADVYRKLGRAGDAERTLKGYEQNRTLAPPLDDPLMDQVRALNAGATGLMRQAQAAERDGRIEEAAALCEKAVAETPDFEQAWINLISLYGRLGQPAKLERAYRAAAGLAPDRAETHYNYGVFCIQAERFEDARKAFEKTVALDPRNADAWNNLGSVLERYGALDRAAECFRRAAAARPEFPLAHFHLGRILANQRRYDAAIQEFQKSLAPESDQTPAYLYALAATHARAGHRQQSVDLMRRARAQAAQLGQPALVVSIDRDLSRLAAR